MRVIKWAWRYRTLDIEVYDSINDAVEAAEGAEDAGVESLDCLEVVYGGVPNRIISAEEVRGMWRERRGPYIPAPAATTRVSVVHPTKSVRSSDLFVDSTKAEEWAGQLKSLVGDRVTVESLEGEVRDGEHE